MNATKPIEKRDCHRHDYLLRYEANHPADKVRYYECRKCGDIMTKTKRHDEEDWS